MQDNRIPGFLKSYFSKSHQVDNNIDGYLLFSNLRDNFGHADQEDWILVAVDEASKAPHCLNYMASCFIRPENEDSLKQFMSHSSWHIDDTFGIPHKYYVSKYEEETEYNNGLTYQIDGIMFKPFVFLREFEGKRPAFFEIVQEFILYYNAFWVEENQAYQRFCSSENITTLIRVEKCEGGSQVFVRTEYLLDYLNIHKMILMRFFDYRRFTFEETSLTNNDCKFQKLTLAEPNKYFFELNICSENRCSSYNTSSRLLGKDILQNNTVLSSHLIKNTFEEKHYCEFVFFDENGEIATETCNDNLLTNYFEDKGKAHFFQPVFFQRKVLTEYYNNYAQYHVSEKAVGKRLDWEITYAIIDDNTIAVYLGDLGKKLPYSEQMHWKKYNICSRSLIPSYIIERDMNCKIIEPPIELLPIEHLRKRYYRLQEISQCKFKSALILPLHENDIYNFDCLHIPITEEFNEFDTQIQSMAKLINDSINVELLKKIITLKEGEEIPKASIKILWMYLAQISNAETATAITTPLTQLQRLRSESNAHRKGSNFEKTKAKLSINQYTIRKVFKQITLQVIESLEKMCEAIENT